MNAEQPTYEDVLQAVTDIQEARMSHARWAAHLRNTNRHDCQGCADHAAHIGEASYHDEWIEKYDRVIRLLARVPYEAAASGAQTCVKCGHNNVNSKGECRQCIDWQKHVLRLPRHITYKWKG